MTQQIADQLAEWRSARDRIDAGSDAEVAAILADRAAATRRAIIHEIDQAQQGHFGGDMSVTDILTTLFSAVMNIDPSQPDWPDRDRFILSKGHCSAALYATLANTGYFPATELDTFMRPLSALNGHPNRNRVPGVETNTGPLGHGLPVAVGQAIAARLQGREGRVFVVLGDGETQEGSNWEAYMAAAHYGLHNLIAIIDRNRLQQGARTEDTNGLEPLDAKLAAFGCEVRVTDGHDYTQLIHALRPATGTQPVAVIANTIKGRGVSFAEDRVEWHHKVPTATQVELALQELS